MLLTSLSQRTANANEIGQQKEHKESLLHPHRMPPAVCGRRQLGRQDGPGPAPHLKNPQPPAPVGIGRDQASTSSVSDTVMSPLPCPSLPEAPAEKEPPGLDKLQPMQPAQGRLAALCSGVTATECRAGLSRSCQGLHPHSTLVPLQKLCVALQSPKRRRKAAHTPLLPFPFLLTAGRAG